MTFSKTFNVTTVLRTRILRALPAACTAVALIAFASLSAHGQGGTTSSGCDTSPENPTAILALVGSASAFAVAMRDRLRRK